MKELKFGLSAMVLAMTGMMATTTPASAFDYGYRADNYFYTWHIDNAIMQNSWFNDDSYKKTYKKAKSSKKSTTKKTTSSSGKSSKASSGKSSTSKGSTSQSTATPKTPDYSNAHRYSHSNSVSSQLNSQMIDTLRQDLQNKGRLTSQATADLDRLSKSNLIGQVKTALKSDGYDPNSIATAMAYWVVINYGIATRSDLASLKGHGMVEQLKDALSDESIANMSASDKQTMAETLYWLGSLQMAMYMEAVNQNNQTAINQRIQDAKSALSNIGLSTSDIKHGSRGLELG
ncbi:DUF6683 family protein [Moraxella sp. VT-16-12]|uniref:DUF6683 family protein n=1 Tax=Moraxella sp. VT-16-12 TaxID=2014877 RepID=UPI000B7D0DBA|nr:DUF6683 family protein [Moraxella sp. VT-16-12]TWV80781.1 hypothetical protein CEW93_009270 [Moraxella sp. VT-16-12]